MSSGNIVGYLLFPILKGIGNTSLVTFTCFLAFLPVYSRRITATIPFHYRNILDAMVLFFGGIPIILIAVFLVYILDCHRLHICFTLW